MSIATSPSRLSADTEDGIYYPSSDGRPMGETGWHVISTMTLYSMLREHLADRDAYVAANMFLYYERGNTKANRSPDCMVILGVPREPERRSFKTWVEGASPAVIFEFASPDTVSEDLKAKRELYQRLGVAEYFLFDPTDECLAPRLQGMHLVDGVYVDFRPEADGALTSEVLGLRFVPDGMLLRVYDQQTGLAYPTGDEKNRQIDAQMHMIDAQLLQVQEQTRQAEAERLRAEEQARQAEAERLRAEEQTRQAEAERLRADALVAEVKRLRALLGERDGGPR